jgi:hypothetical protein
MVPQAPVHGGGDTIDSQHPRGVGTRRLYIRMSVTVH